MVIVQPIYDGNVEGSKLIQLHDRDKQTIGNVYGLVVAIGPEYPWKLKVGDKVLFRRHEGTPFMHEDKEHVSLKSKWVEAITK